MWCSAGPRPWRKAPTMDSRGMKKLIAEQQKFLYFVVRVNASFNLPIKNKLHQFIFQGRNSGVERLGHLSDVCRHIRTEVLDQGFVPDLAVQGVHMWGNVHVQHQVVLRNLNYNLKFLQKL
jgi:hypothetical protein